MTIPYEQLLVFGNMRSSVFYKTQEWRKARYLALTTLGNRCQLCGALPKDVPMHVDHIRPRSLYPALCLDPTNLQVLCECCHTAKGMQFLDDCRAKHTQKPALALSDLLRLERHHMVIAMRPPKHRELVMLGTGIRAASQKHRSRWRLFLHWCWLAKQNYGQARQTTVAQFLQTPWCSNAKFQKFLHHPHSGPKAADDPLFDIAGLPFPPHLHTLLAADQAEISYTVFS